jgi:4-amino-4-deoxy-L-arabinose transferase-like glycosyltransferase
MKVRTALHLGLLGLVCGQLFFWRLGDRDLWSSHEARAAQDAQRILETGDWLVPRLFDDQVELQKPPLFYWLVAAAGRLGGGTVDAFAVRLPSALAALATVVLVYGFLAAEGRPLAGLLAAIVLATAQHFTWIARTGRIDMPLTFAVTVAILCLGRPRSAETAGVRTSALLIGGYLSIAAGMLLKGPIGLVLPIAVVTTAAVFGRRPVVNRTLLWGIPLMVAAAAPWFVAVHLRTGGEFTRVFFWYHNVQRAAGGTETLAAHPWWFYGPRFAFDFLPWSPVLLGAAWLTLRRIDYPPDPAARLGAVWLVTITLLLSASRFKRADYLIPAYPGAAIWLGCVGERLLQSSRSSLQRRWLVAASAASAAAILGGWAVVLNFVVPTWDAEHGQAAFAAAVRQAAPKPNLVLFFRGEDHLLAYHLGRPLNTFLEWENLDVWVGQSPPHHVVMPAECATEWRQYITSGTLEEVSRFTDRTDRRKPRDLVLMRTVAGKRTDGSADRPTADQQGADQRAVAGPQPGGGPGVDH